MSKGFEQPVELDIAATTLQRGIIVSIHVAGVLPVLSLPMGRAVTMVLLLAVSLLWHLVRLARRPWRGLLLKSGGIVTLLDTAGQPSPAELLACGFCTARVLILNLRVAGGELNLPIFRCCQPEAYRQLRCYLLKYPPGKAARTQSPGDLTMPNGHRRRAGSVF